jgi:hypothetical protein
MDVLDRIEKKEVRDFLGKGWLTHDGLWFYNTYRELGIETANALNKLAIKSLAPIEMHRAKKILGKGKATFDTFGEIKDFMLEALELIMPESLFEKAHFSAPSKGIISWEWEQGECFAYKGIKGMGALDQYKCGVMFRIECWLEALGIKHEFEPKIDMCLMHERGECKGIIKLMNSIIL